MFVTLILLSLNNSHAFVPTTNIDGVNLEKAEIIKNVSMATAKKDSTRIVRGFKTQEFAASLDVIKNAIINFDEKCNNEHKSKRKFTDKTKDCKYLNKNLIETVIVKKTKYTGAKEPNETERFVVTRYILNSVGNFAQNDLMVAYEYTNAAKEKVFELKQYLLSDDDSKIYLDNPVKKDSPFKETTGHFMVTEKSKDKSVFDYEYIGKTDKWYLNKDMFLGKIYNGTADGIADLFISVELAVAAKK
ncbi:MAG: hypothetical protein ACOYL6_06745 [Bacteriovoracaceae bacterium]